MSEQAPTTEQQLADTKARIAAAKAELAALKARRTAYAKATKTINKLSGRIRRAMNRREQERLSLPNKRWARDYYAQWADCPF
jgi:chromosome segregation ATPase